MSIAIIYPDGNKTVAAMEKCGVQPVAERGSAYNNDPEALCGWCPGCGGDVGVEDVCVIRKNILTEIKRKYKDFTINESYKFIAGANDVSGTHNFTIEILPNGIIDMIKYY